MDLVFYDEDFFELLDVAKTLEVKEMLVVDFPANKFEEIKKIQKRLAVKLIPAKMITKNDLSKVNSTANMNGKKQIIVGTSERGCIEHPLVKCIIDSEISEKKDRLHQRSSGLNYVLAKIASKNKKILLLNLSLLKFEKKERILGRFLQNVMLARKAKLPMLVVSGAIGKMELRSPTELKFVASSFGIPNQLSKLAIKELRELAN
jgi:RNase P/RNase MRP subunit p30